MSKEAREFVKMVEQGIFGEALGSTLDSPKIRKEQALERLTRRIEALEIKQKCLQYEVEILKNNRF